MTQVDGLKPVSSRPEKPSAVIYRRYPTDSRAQRGGRKSKSPVGVDMRLQSDIRCLEGSLRLRDSRPLVQESDYHNDPCVLILLLMCDCAATWRSLILEADRQMHNIDALLIYAGTPPSILFGLTRGTWPLSVVVIGCAPTAST
jgi:hypothetical protein